MATNLEDIDTQLFKTADQLRANSGLKPSEYSRPALGLLFLRYAESQAAAVEATGVLPRFVEAKPVLGEIRTSRGRVGRVLAPSQLGTRRSTGVEVRSKF